jgi:nucleoside-diphosphate-sugar epimerase
VVLSDPAALTAVVGGIRPEWIFHLAVHGAYANQTDLRQMVQTNILGTINLVEACLKTEFEAFVNTGSSSEYGLKDHAPSEREWLEPNSHYAVTKASATLFCRHTAQAKGARIPTLRLYSAYGPYEEPTRLIPRIVMKGLRGEYPPLANPDVARDFVFADDVTDAFLLAAARPHQEPGAVYNVGTGVQTSLREVVQTAQRAMKIAAEPAWGSMPNRQWDTNVWVSDSRRIRTELGWQPLYTFEQGLRQTVHWFLENPALQRLYGERGSLT